MSIGDRQIPLDRRITLAEAARLSGKSERTLRRWYHQGKLQAMQEGGINSLLYFDIQQIAALAGSTAILQRLDLIEARLASLERLESRVQELEGIIQGLQEKAVKNVPTPARAMPSSAIRITQGKSTLPGGLVPASSFAAMHGVHENTIRKAIASGRIAAITGRWQHGRATVTTALDASGRAAFYAIYSARPDFQTCSECPHEVDALQG